MIPITSFAGKKVAVFGLGSSGLIAASALFAGGADVVGWDDSAARIAHAASAGDSDRRPARARLVEDRRAGARARRAAHPSGAALVGRPRPRHGRRGHRRHRAVLPRAARATRPMRPFVAITGTNGKSTTTALIAHLCRERRLRHPARRQYRHRDPVAGAAADGPRPRDRVLVVPDRPRAQRSIRRSAS